jgi:hypothetical protein
VFSETAEFVRSFAAPSVASIAAAAGGAAVPWLGVMGLVGAGFSGERGGGGAVSELVSKREWGGGLERGGGGERVVGGEGVRGRRGLGVESRGRGERVVVEMGMVGMGGGGGDGMGGGGMEEGEVCNNALGYHMPRCCFLLPLGTMLLTLI